MIALTKTGAQASPAERIGSRLSILNRIKELQVDSRKDVSEAGIGRKFPIRSRVKPMPVECAGRWFALR